MVKQQHQLTRTTLRIRQNLKKMAEKLAIDQDTTLQHIFNQALQEYLDKQHKKKAAKIVFQSKNLGVPLDNLTRNDIYDEPYSHS